MDEAALRRVVRAYGLVPVSFEPAQKGYRNTSYAITLDSGLAANFILYKRETGIVERIRRAHRTGDFLAQYGLPARQTIDARIIRLHMRTVPAYGALYGYLSGQTIPWDAYTKAHIKLVGMAMSSMHAHLARLSPLPSHTVVDEYGDIMRRMQAYFEERGVQAALSQRLKVTTNFSFQKLQGLLLLSQTLPGQQVLHMDFVRGNLLFNTPSPTDKFAIGSYALSGILDFEKTAVGHPVLDVARTLAFLLVDCRGKTPEAVEKYFLQSGYNKRGEAHFRRPVVFHNGQKVDLLDQFVTLFLIHDFYKFLRHNPYEYLEQNEHFIRTRDILSTRNMVDLLPVEFR